MVENILIFTLEGCPHCVSLKNKLLELKINFIEVDILKNEELWNQVHQQTKHNTVPTIFFKMQGTDSGPVFAPGRDFQNEDEIVEIIKKHI